MPLLRCSLPFAPLVVAALVIAPPAIAQDTNSFCTDPNGHSHGGLALRWDACVSDGGTANKVFACDSNSGTETLVASFVLADPAQNVPALRIHLDLASSTSNMPDWWQLNRPSCRTGPVSSNVLSMSPISSPSAVACTSPWPASATGGITTFPSFPYGPSTEEIDAVFAVPPGEEPSLPAGVEIFCMRILINHANTLQCGGCSTPVCLALSEVDLQGLAPDPADFNYTDRAICGPAFGSDSNLATWQGAAIGSANAQPLPGHEFFQWETTEMVCAAATPARRMVWGSIKALYR